MSERYAVHRRHVAGCRRFGIDSTSRSIALAQALAAPSKRGLAPWQNKRALILELACSLRIGGSPEICGALEIGLILSAGGSTGILVMLLVRLYDKIIFRTTTHVLVWTRPELSSLNAIHSPRGPRLSLVKRM